MSLVLALGARAQSTPTRPAVADALPAGWEEIDQRLVFFTVQLASIETSLKSVNIALVQAGYQQSLKQGDSARYQLGNQIMDRNAGGPVDWQEFYGKTANAFFYHPRRGEIVVSVGKGQPPSARPPQFDYIYRANAQAEHQSDIEVARLGGKIDALLARRSELESQQTAAWAKIAFEAVASRKFTAKPLYRFELDMIGTGDPVQQEPGALRAATTFMRDVISFMSTAEESADKDPASAFSRFKKDVTAAQSSLDDRLIHLPKVALASADPSTSLGRFVAAADRLGEVSKNISDSYDGALTGARKGDQQLSRTMRAYTQQALFDCATNVNTTNDCVTELASEWKAAPNVEKPLTSPGKQAASSLPRDSDAAAASSGVPAQQASVPVPAIAPSPAATTPPLVPPDQALAYAPPVVPGTGQVAARVTLSSQQPISAGLQLTSDGGPYEIKDKLMPAKGVKKLTLSVQPGAEVRLGNIEIGSDLHIDIEGSSDRPAIFRNVAFNQTLGGDFTARYAIFDHCSFQKVGSNYSQLSSKWKFDDCLLSNCTFPGFAWVNYGISFSETTFVGMTLHELGIKGEKNKPPEDMDSLRTQWRKFDRCAFYDCTILPTVFWCSEDSDYWRCTFRPGKAYESDRTTQVHAYIADTQGETPDKVLSANPPKRSPLVFSFAASPLPIFSFPAQSH